MGIELWFRGRDVIKDAMTQEGGMTKAGKKWCRETLEVNWIDAQHVLRAFISEVEKRATFDGHTHGKECFNECFGAAFTELVDELLGATHAD
jgi:ribosomal protein L19E